MKNITVTLDEPLAAWLRASAARQGMSVSRFLGDLIYGRMHEAREYNEAMRQFLARAPYRFEWAHGRPPTRDEIHDRAHAREELLDKPPDELK